MATLEDAAFGLTAALAALADADVTYQLRCSQRLLLRRTEEALFAPLRRHEAAAVPDLGAAASTLAKTRGFCLAARAAQRDSWSPASRAVVAELWALYAACAQECRRTGLAAVLERRGYGNPLTAPLREFRKRP